MGIKKDVRRGIRLLKDQGPIGWQAKIDLDTLDLGSSYDCVLGQVYGSFCAGLISLDIAGSAHRYGFSPSVMAGYQNSIKRHTKRWIKELSK